jgi:hypothetical protein
VIFDDVSIDDERRRVPDAGARQPAATACSGKDEEFRHDQ